MFSKLMSCKSCNIKPRKVVFCLVVLQIFVLFSLGIYYYSFPNWTVKREALFRKPLQLHNSVVITEVHHNALPSKIDHLQGLHGNKAEDASVNASSMVTPQRNVAVSSLKMEGCPDEWPLEVIRYDSVGMPAAQVCRRTGGNEAGHWKCASGWRPLHSDPYCTKYSTSSAPASPSSDKENLDSSQFKTLQFVAENPKLLFYHLPGTSVEVSSSVFRASRENETSDHSLLHYHKFTFIMHPCLRLINVWEKMMMYSKVNVTFRSFLNGRLPPWKPLLLFDEIHLKTQSEILLGNNGRVWLDQILVLETWNESLAELKKRVDLKPNGFKFLRATSSNSTKCSRMYSQESWLQMMNSYAMDFCVFQYSFSINETNILPSLDLTMEALMSRYHLCKQNETNLNISPISNFSPRQFVSPNLCTIHTYYQPAFDNPQDIMESESVLRVWEKTWVAAGWQTRVVNETDAKLHPDYQELKEKFQALPTINPEKYTFCSFVRHVAMATVGGGWMSDYDTLPLNFPPCLKIPFHGSYTVWSGFVPALVSANANEYTRVAHLMADVGLQWRVRPKFFLRSGRSEVSDMTALSVLVKEGQVNSFEVVIKRVDLSDGEFACDISKLLRKSPNSGNLPEGMPLLPWGIHLSHALMSFIRTRNITLWPGLSWEKATSPSFRQTFMAYVHNIYLRKCNIPGNRTSY
ncbi:hypothetical protein HOLleu_06864 [Holothuria leucospilota]|uniref:Uncharacterized protein n=1 Tax=Holothuria leucospilota TaxID=206669 RepID=A0A9Q1HJV0_HOLLE|nr:hypothetical protein HOLleu_06864 [Holothuria leucospilota]